MTDSPQTDTPPSLRDIPEPTLRMILRVLERQFPASLFRSPSELTGDVPLKMAMHQGSQAVLEEFRRALIPRPPEDPPHA